MKQTIEDDKLKDKISDDDRKSVLDKCNEIIQWIDGNQVLQIIIPYFLQRSCNAIESSLRLSLGYFYFLYIRQCLNRHDLHSVQSYFYASATIMRCRFCDVSAMYGIDGTDTFSANFCH